MKTIEIQLYKFDELSDEAKENAIQKWIKSEYEGGDPLMFFEDYCIEEAKEKGFYDCKFQWSLNYCQGDGLSFSGSFDVGVLANIFLDHLGKGKEKTAKLLADNCTVEIKGNTGRYCYAAKSDVDLYIENYTSSINTDMANIQLVVNNVLADLQELYMNLCKSLEDAGYKEIDWYFSEENAKESIQANEYDFTADGEIY